MLSLLHHIIWLIYSLLFMTDLEALRISFFIVFAIYYWFTSNIFVFKRETNVFLDFYMHILENGFAVYLVSGKKSIWVMMIMSILILFIKVIVHVGKKLKILNIVFFYSYFVWFLMLGLLSLLET
eukprot:25595_1